MLSVTVFCLLALTVIVGSLADHNSDHAKQVVRQVNKIGEWKAKTNSRFAHMSDAEQKQLCGSIVDDDEKDKMAPEAPAREYNPVAARRRKRATCTDTVVFDARKEWPQCAAIINKIQDQSSCGNCWAVASASAFSDRHCIERAKKGLNTSATDGTGDFSAIDVTSCVGGTNGCKGGTSYNAWSYFYNKGLSTGSDYNSATGCKPYPFEPMGWDLFTSPACQESCTNKKWGTSYQNDKKKATWFKMISGDGTVPEMERELKKNGTLTCTMGIYEGLMFYKNGVYKRVTPKEIGNHAVRVIGYGYETCSDGSKHDYWMVANSWGPDWGNKGFFKISKGTNECGIEGKRVVFGGVAV